MQAFIQPINLVVEGDTDEIIVRRILEEANIPVRALHGRNGKAHLLTRLANYNRAAQFTPWLVVIDLNHSAECAPAFIEQHLPEPSHLMCFRVAVREIESWLLADREAIAKFLRISINLIPRKPDNESDPKRTFINLARRSRNTSIVRDIVPAPESSSSVGIGYLERLLEFVIEANPPWRPDVAAQHSDSLRRCIVALQQWRETLRSNPNE